MPRFEIKKTSILEGDGSTQEYEVIADLSTFIIVESHFGNVKVGRGFIRCKGRHYIGPFGNSPVYGGKNDDIYYAPMSFFDGDWSHSGVNSRGLHTVVTQHNGSGKLFAKLEDFSLANNVTASN